MILGIHYHENWCFTAVISVVLLTDTGGHGNLRRRLCQRRDGGDGLFIWRFTVLKEFAHANQLHAVGSIKLRSPW